MSNARLYWHMGKPRVVALMLLTAIIGMCMATPHLPSWHILLLANCGIALCAAAAATLNQILDQHIDRQMKRTQWRPLASNQLSARQALVWAALLSISGTFILWFGVNPLTAILTLCALIGYAFIYTVLLKHITAQNIVIGGITGAAPPLLGWTAVTGTIEAEALLLVLIIFVWTPPHFWSLALARRTEYAQVNIPMLPVSHGVRYTKWHILFYTALLFVASLLPFIVQMSGVFYLLGAFVLGIGFLVWAIALLLKDSEALAMLTFRYSIIYLAALFIIMLVDHYL